MSNIIRILCKGSLVFLRFGSGLILGVFLTGVAGLYLTGKLRNEPASKFPSSAKQECSSFIRLKLDKLIFAVPRGAALWFVNYLGEGVRGHLPCDAQHFIFEASSFGYSVSEVLGYSVDKVKYQVRDHEVFPTMRVVVRVPLPHKSQDTYESAIASGWLKSDMTSADLPIEEGFYTYSLHNTSRNEYLLIPADESFATPRGNPVIFTCHDRHFVGRHKGIPYCATAFAWKNAVVITLSELSLSWIPRTELKDVYYRTVKFVESLEESRE